MSKLTTSISKAFRGTLNQIRHSVRWVMKHFRAMKNGDLRSFNKWWCFQRLDVSLLKSSVEAKRPMLSNIVSAAIGWFWIIWLLLRTSFKAWTIHSMVLRNYTGIHVHSRTKSSRKLQIWIKWNHPSWFCLRFKKPKRKYWNVPDKKEQFRLMLVEQWQFQLHIWGNFLPKKACHFIIKVDFFKNFKSE